MKKLRILSILLVLAMLVCAFAACDDEEPTKKEEPPIKSLTFAEILNTEYNPTEKVSGAITEIPDLKGYEILREEYTDEWDDPYYIDFYNDYYAVFYKESSKDPNTVTYKIYSFVANKVVATFKNDSKTTHEFVDFHEYDYYYDEYDESPSITVYKSVAKEVDGVLTGEYTKTLITYDLSGKQIATKTIDYLSYYNIARPSFVIDDLVLYKNKLYTYNEKTGELTEKGNVPVNIDIENIIDYCSFKSDNYLYTTSSTTLKVHNYNFKAVAAWATPANVTYARFYRLNNDNVLIQYSKELTHDAKEYDYYTINDYNKITKYDLVTEIFSVTEGTTKALNFNYMISKCLAYTSTDEENMYSDTFENVLTIYPIVDKRISTSAEDVDFVLFTNDGKTGESLKLTDKQTSLPMVIAKNVYAVNTLYGYVTVDLKGEIISQISGNFEIIGGYVLNDYGIYDLKFKLVHDFEDENMVECRTIGDTIFVKQYASADNHDEYTYLAFSGGEKKEIWKKTKDSKEYFYFASEDIYCIGNSETNELKYYNINGELLLTTKVSLYDYKGNILMGYSDGETPVYYFITK